METITIPEPIFEPQSLNIEFFFEKIYFFLKGLFNFIMNPQLWTIIGIISIVTSIIFLAIIIFSIVRLREMQLDDKRELAYKINKALLSEEEKNKSENPRWNNVLVLTESKNESDWRMAVMEADSILEELLKEKGISGNTVSELLEAARSNGYPHIQDAWDAHLIRNQIAHEGANFSLSQIEARRVIKMFQNFFEGLEVK